MPRCRRIACSSPGGFTLDEFKRIRSLVPGSTINDAVLAVCGGALRRYLLAHDELPGPSLVAMAPLSIRNADTSTGSRPSALSLMRVPLGTELEDPVRRLRYVHQHTANAEDIEQAVGAKELTDVTKHAPAATLAMSARLLAGSSLSLGQRQPLASCTVTNVPGPAVPLYLNGARMTYFSAIMPISDGMGLVFSVTSYDGKIFISPTSCREQIPDPEYFAICIRESFQSTWSWPASRSGGARRGQEEGQAEGQETGGIAAQGRVTPAAARPPVTTSGGLRHEVGPGLVDRPEASVEAPRLPVAFGLCQPSATMHITAALKPSPMWLPGTQMFSCWGVVGLEPSRLRRHYAVGHRVDARRRHRRRGTEHLGAHVREVCDRAHRVGEVSVDGAHQQPRVELVGEKCSGLPSEMTVRTHSGALCAV